MGKATAQIEISASSSKLVAGLSAAAAKFHTFAGSVARGMGTAFKKINAKMEPGSTAKHAIGNFAGDMMGRGMDAFVDAAKGVRNFESDLQRLGQTTHQTPAQMQALSASMRKTSVDTGINSEEIMKAAGAYFDLTSDTKGMDAALKTFAKTSQASGANMEDLVRIGAAAGDSMGIASSEFESMFSGLIAQGEAGKISLSEAATEFPELLAMASKFKVVGRQGMTEMFAMYQVGAKAFGSGSKAATGMSAAYGMIQARAGQIKKHMKIDVFEKGADGVTRLKSFSKIVDEIAKKGIDPRKAGKIFGENKEGRNFLDMLIKKQGDYNTVLAAGANTTAVQEGAMARADSKAGRLDLAFNRIKESIAAAFTPERIEAFTNGIEQLAQRLGPVLDKVGWIADKLGGLAGVGKSIRGALEGEANPYAEDEQRAALTKRMGANAYIMRGATSPADIAEMKRRDADYGLRAKGFRGARDNIMAGEVDEKTTPDSIKRAVLAAYSGGSGAESDAARLAGSMYLDAAKVKPSEAKEIYGKEFANALKESGVVDLLAKIAGNPTKLQIGENQVARAADGATDARRDAH